MKIAFVASHAKNSQEALQRFSKRYGQIDTDDADVIVVLGGDGFMLHSLHQFMYRKIPLFGLRRGTVGFLMNNFELDDLEERIDKAQKTILHPLSMEAEKVNGEQFSSLAINEVSLLRQTKQSAHIEVRINNQTKIETLVGDGIMVATPAGSTAYNLSAHGPVIPLGTQVLTVTPISPFRPRRWRGAIIPSHAEVCFRIQNDTKRPVAATADNFEVRDVKQVIIREARDIEIELLFDAQHNLEDRIINEQFA